MAPLQLKGRFCWVEIRRRDQSVEILTRLVFEGPGMARTTEVRYCPNGAIAWKVEEAMDTSLFDWDEANVGHIAEHDISPEEAEEVILNDPMDIGFEETEDGEERWSYVGETNQGSIYQVVMTLRGEKIRVVTAFEPTRQDRLVYMEMKAQQQ